MSNAPSPASDGDPQRGARGPTPVPPRGGKNRGGGRPASRPQANRGKGRQARQAAQRRNRMYAFAGVGAAVVIIAVVVAVGVAGSASAAPRQPVPATAVSQMQSISLQTMTDAASKVTQLQFAASAKGGPLVSGGKPEVLFIGAEFCPICAAERWPMTIALMKFGTFTNLQETRSAVADGNAGTWSYYGSTYNSQYLSFDPNELYTNQPSGNYYKPLQKLSASDQAIWTANEGSSLSFPFIDLGGKEVLETAQYNPSTIYYKNFQTVLGAVGSNDNSLGASVDASAAVFTKYLCGLTNNQPGSVCSAVANVNAPVTSTNTGQTTPANG